MNKTEEIKYQLEMTGRILSNTSYYYDNLDYLINNTSEEEKVVFNSFPILKKLRLTLWSLIVMDLHKIISKSSNDKFRIHKLINLTIDSYKSIKWEHKIELYKLKKIKVELKKVQPKIDKIKEIRDTQIAHFDDIKLDYKLELIELKEIINFCQETYNTISYSLQNSSIYWKFSDSVMFNPVVISLNKYSKIKNLFFKNLASMNEKIDTSELGKIIRASKSGK